MEKDGDHWERMRFRNNKVWMAVDLKGNPILKTGKVLIKYQLDQDYEYWVNEKSIRPLESPQAGREVIKEAQSQVKKPPGSVHKLQEAKEVDEKNAVCIYTDGASSGNPGPSGIGILLRYGDHEKEISRYIGIATNNIAELEAIKTGLLELKSSDIPVRLFTDSSYAYGVLTLGWKARKNQKLIQSIRALISKFKDLKFIKVKGHTGHVENEMADRLATSAIDKNRIME